MSLLIRRQLRVPNGTEPDPANTDEPESKFDGAII